MFKGGLMYTISFTAWQSWLFIFITVALSIVIGYILCRDTYQKTFMDAYKRAQGNSIINVQPHAKTVLKDALLRGNIILILGGNEVDRRAAATYITSLSPEIKNFNLLVNTDFKELGSFAYDYLKVSKVPSIIITNKADISDIMGDLAETHFCESSNVVNKKISSFLSTVVKLVSTKEGISIDVEKYSPTQERYINAVDYCLSCNISEEENVFDAYSANNYSSMLELNRERVRLKSIMLNEDLDIDMSNEDKFYTIYNNYINHKVTSKEEYDKMRIELISLNEQLKRSN